VNVQVNSWTGPLQQLKAPPGMCIVCKPGMVTGDVVYWNRIVVLPLIKVTASAGIPLHVKSLGCTVAGSTGQATLTSKTVGGVNTTPPQPALVTEQDMGVGVGVGVPAPGGSLSKKVSPWETPLIVTRPSTHPTRCWSSTEEA